MLYRRGGRVSYRLGMVKTSSAMDGAFSCLLGIVGYGQRDTPLKNQGLLHS